ncbi:hypothetical protein ABTC54_19550, partial [Acinetobacter baumannii]
SGWARRVVSREDVRHNGGDARVPLSVQKMGASGLLSCSGGDCLSVATDVLHLQLSKAAT